MTSAEPLPYGSIRFTEMGDVEIFDGTAWHPIAPLLTDANVGDRGDGRADPLAGEASDVSAI